MKYLGGLFLLLIAMPAHAAYFGWLAPHAALPSAAWCASQIPATPETIPANAAQNAAWPTAAQLAAFHANPNGDAGQVVPIADYANVYGDYAAHVANPSTDMIIRWAACKWGVDENWLRAQAWEESGWNEGTRGDTRTDYADCTALSGALSLWSPTAQPNCAESLSIIQMKVVPYFWSSYPMLINSTGFALDEFGAQLRGCINGDQLSYFVNNGTDNMGAPTIPSYETATGLTLDEYCGGAHFSGQWGDAGAQGYVAALVNLMAQQPWLGL